MRLHATALAVAAGLVAASPAMAIDQAGNWEVQLIGAGSSDNDFDSGGFTATAQVGHFFTDQLQLAVRQSIGYVDTGADSDFSAATRLGGYYHFNYDTDQRWVPFIGVDIGYIYGDGVTDSFVAGPSGGLRYFVNDTTFISATISYEFLFDDADEADDQFSDGQFVYGLGIGFQW